MTEEQEKGAPLLYRILLQVSEMALQSGGMKETAAEKTEVACHTGCLALVPFLNGAHFFRVHVMLRRRTKCIIL